MDELRDWPTDRSAAELSRVGEILAEWDPWTEECIAHDEALGLDEAYWQLEDLVPQQRPLVERIVAIRATTIAGLQVMARIPSISGYTDDEERATTRRSVCWRSGRSCAI